MTDEPTTRTIPLACGCFYWIIEWPPRPEARSFVACCEEHTRQVEAGEAVTELEQVRAC